MSAKSKGTSAKSEAKGGAGLDRPFAADVLRRAEDVVKRYQVVIWPEGGEYYARGVEMPGVMADGKTPSACYSAIYEALKFTVATVLEAGETPPPAAVEGQRTEQVNIRLSAEEKMQMETAAQQRGYRGLADFLRAAGIATANTPVGSAAGPRPAVREPGSVAAKYAEDLLIVREGGRSRVAIIQAKKGQHRTLGIVETDTSGRTSMRLPNQSEL